MKCWLEKNGIRNARNRVVVLASRLRMPGLIVPGRTASRVFMGDGMYLIELLRTTRRGCHGSTL